MFAIFVSACVAGYEAVDRLLNPHEPEYLAALALAGAVGFLGNWWAALIRTRAGQRLDSPALIADGAHARADAYVSLAVIASAGAVAAGADVADPLIGLGITLVILKITVDSLATRGPLAFGPVTAAARQRGRRQRQLAGQRLARRRADLHRHDVARRRRAR